MNKKQFPIIALIIGFFALGTVMGGQFIGPDGSTVLPLLVLLMLSELALIVTGLGAWFGFQRLRQEGFSLIPGIVTIACALMVPLFLKMGLDLWPL